MCVCFCALDITSLKHSQKSGVSYKLMLSEWFYRRENRKENQNLFSTGHLSAFGRRAKSRVFGCDNLFTS